MVLGIGTLVVLPLALPSPALAIANPNDTVIAECYVFRNLLETGDWLVYARYNVNYTTVPDEPASDYFEMVVLNTTGTAILGDRKLNYYQENITSCYWSTSQATAAGLAWGSAYIVKVRGSPSVFPSLIEGVNQATWILAASDYCEQTKFATLMLAEAEVLQNDWGITLLSAGYLNITGLTYFTYAIPNFSSMAPEASAASMTYPSGNLSWINQTEPYLATLQANTGTKLSGALDAIASALHVSRDWAAIWMVAIACLTFSGVVYSVTKDPGISMMMGIPVVIGAAFLGVAPSMLSIVTAMTIVAAVLFGIHFILARMW